MNFDEVEKHRKQAIELVIAAILTFDRTRFPHSKGDGAYDFEHESLANLQEALSKLIFWQASKVLIKEFLREAHRLIENNREHCTTEMLNSTFKAWEYFYDNLEAVAQG